MRPLLLRAQSVIQLMRAKIAIARFPATAMATESSAPAQHELEHNRTGVRQCAHARVPFPVRRTVHQTRGEFNGPLAIPLGARARFRASERSRDDATTRPAIQSCLSGRAERTHRNGTRSQQSRARARVYPARLRRRIYIAAVRKQ